MCTQVRGGSSPLFGIIHAKAYNSFHGDPYDFAVGLRGLFQPPKAVARVPSPFAQAITVPLRPRHIEHTMQQIPVMFRSLWSLCSGSLRCPRHGGSSRPSYMLLAFLTLRRSEILKEGFRGFPFCEVINEAMLVVEPILPCARDKRGSAVFRCVHRFHCVHRPHCLIPPQRTSKRKPEMRIQERFCHGDDEG
jgi:hypothetical protein